MIDIAETVFRPEPIPDGIVDVAGKPYMADAKGALVPVETIKPQDKLEDETVRKIMGFALGISGQIDRFKAHTMADLDALDAVLEQEHGFIRRGNKGKGNRRYLTLDGLMKVEVTVADYVDFGPQLQIAKGLIDECLNEWAADSRPEIRAIITRAFNTDKAGQVNRSEIFMLLRLAIEDARWKRAMDAIRDAMRVVGSKSYVRFAMRDAPDAAWLTISVNLAKA